ncbi:hypothetical protein KCP69_08405 [Salmonella enterica subsp. enterica]|nr:hypothetical protein KCP69_08405 [Salmonella enterica subsp. enterica]
MLSLKQAVKKRSGRISTDLKAWPESVGEVTDNNATGISDGHIGIARDEIKPSRADFVKKGAPPLA